MGNFLHDVVELAKRSEKPRKAGLTMLVVKPTLEGIPGPVRIYHPYVDKVKFTIQALWVDEEVMAKNIRAYRDLNIDVQIGGVPYELAMAQGKQKQFINKIRSLGVNMIEVESHGIGLSLEQMKDEVRSLQDTGFEVIGEVGSKWLDYDETREVQDRVLVGKVINKMQSLLAVGAKYIYWEGMVVRALIGNQLENKVGQKQLLEVAKEVGADNIVFEIWDARSGGNSQFWAWLVSKFGPDVNIGNAHLEEIGNIECVRRGCIYDHGHPYLRWLSQGKPTKNWWEMPFPDYAVDIQKPPVWQKTR